MEDQTERLAVHVLKPAAASRDEPLAGVVAEIGHIDALGPQDP